MPVVGFDSQEDFDRARRSIAFTENVAVDATGRRGRYPIGGGDGGSVVEGRLLTSFTPADSRLTGAKEFDFVRFVVDASIVPQTVPATMKEQTGSDGNPVATRGVNRSTILFGNADAYVVAMRINGEWRPVIVEDICQ